MFLRVVASNRSFTANNIKDIPSNNHGNHALPGQFHPNDGTLPDSGNNIGIIIAEVTALMTCIKTVNAPIDFEFLVTYLKVCKNTICAIINTTT